MVSDFTGLNLAGPLGWAVLGILFLGSVAAGYCVGGWADTKGKNWSESIYNGNWSSSL